MRIGLRAMLPLLVAALSAGAAGSAGCESEAGDARCELPREPEQRRIQVGGSERSYWIVAGPAAVPPAAVVFLWHGWGADARSMMRALEPKRYWREAVVVAPLVCSQHTALLHRLLEWRLLLEPTRLRARGDARRNRARRWRWSGGRRL